MDCILINLDNQPERRRQVEENFTKTRTTNWTLSRMSAVNVQQVATCDVRGRLTPPEKGCFLSHLMAISASRRLSGHIMIVEDDVLFGERSFQAIDTVLNLASAFDWDIIFTDVCVPHIPTMLEMYKLRKQLAPANKLQMLPLDKIAFFGSASYIVNAQSKDKLLGLLTEKPALDAPYDVTLGQLMGEKQLRGFVAFPFPTSLSGFADASQIQRGDTKKIADSVWNAFRRLIWLEGSAGAATENLDRVQDALFDPECRVFSKILGCILSLNLVAR